MIAMYMAIYAQECFPKFSEILKNHFKGLVNENWEPMNWEIKLGYKENVIRIW